MTDLVLGEGAALELLVAHAEGAVEAVVLAEVRDVERREQHETLAIDVLLDGARRGEQLGEQLGVADRGQRRDLVELETLGLGGLGEDLADAAGVGPGAGDQRGDDGAFVDEGGWGCVGLRAHASLTRFKLVGDVGRAERLRDLKGELGPLARSGVGANMSVMELHDTPRIVQAQAGPSPLVGGRGVQA